MQTELFAEFPRGRLTCGFFSNGHLMIFVLLLNAADGSAALFP